MKRSTSILVYLALTVAAFGSLPAVAQWPERPITLVVMYGAGGGTDVVLRTLAAQMSESEGWRINVINRPGAAGSAATRYVLNKRNDGYTLLGSSSFGKFARISGDGDSRSWTDWYYLQAGTNLASWSVRPDSPYKTFADVIVAAKANPGQITISTSGTGGLWHEMAASVAQAAGIELKYVPYSGGQTATLAGLNGEVDIAGGGVHEHMQFVDAGQLATLQQTSAEDIVTPDGNVMPSLVNFIPEIKDLLPPNGTYDIGIRRDTPIEIVRELQRAFLAAVNSQHFIDVMERRNFVVDVLVNEEADRRAAQLEVISADTFEKLNIPGARTAEQLNLPEPEDFDTWWPPEGYEPLPL
jgi:tripartite-type tricarboxylate transporter receptor subunit TctC